MLSFVFVMALKFSIGSASSVKDLPGYDNSGVDVFECSPLDSLGDSDLSSSLRPSITVNKELIETGTIDAKKSFEIFAGHHFVSQTATRLARLSRFQLPSPDDSDSDHTNSNTQNDNQFNPKTIADGETRLQKLERLQREILLFTEELEHDSKRKPQQENDNETNENEGKIMGIAEKLINPCQLQAHLKSLEGDLIASVLKFYSTPSPLPQNSEQSEKSEKSSSVRAVEISQLEKLIASKADFSSSVSSSSSSLNVLSLEERIAHLERLVGCGGDSLSVLGLSDDSSVSSLPASDFAAGQEGIVGIVSRLKEKLGALDKGALEALGKQLKGVNQEIEKVNSRALGENMNMNMNMNMNGNMEGMELGSVISYQHVNSVLAVLERWDGMARQVPRIVDRLVSVRSFHDDAIALKELVVKIDRTQTDISAKMKDSDKKVTQLEEAMNTNMKIIQENCKDIQQRIQKLQQNK